MKTILIALFILFQLGAVLPPVSSVSVDLTTTASAEGSIRLAVFDDPAALSAERPVTGKVIDVKAGEWPLKIKLDDLPKGTFAIAAYHDLNNDGKLNRNLFGVPSEPYAFSGRAASKWRAPLWEEIAVREVQNLSLELRYWKEQ